MVQALPNINLIMFVSSGKDELSFVGLCASFIEIDHFGLIGLQSSK